MIGPASAVTQWGSAGSRSTAANIATYQLLTFVTHLNKHRLLGKWEWAAGCQCQNCTLSKLGRRVFCHLNSHITVHWRKAVKMFLDRFIFTFRWKMKIYAMLRKSAEKKPQLLNTIPCNRQIQKKTSHPISIRPWLLWWTSIEQIFFPNFLAIIIGQQMFINCARN